MSLLTPGETDTILTISEGGFGKRTPVTDYRLQTRGGFGVINIKVTKRNGPVVAVKAVQERRQFDIKEQAQLDNASKEAWANLPENYQWLKDWQYV